MVYGSEVYTDNGYLSHKHEKKEIIVKMHKTV